MLEVKRLSLLKSPVMQELEAKLLKIKALLYLMLVALTSILFIAAYLAVREKTRIQGCGVSSPTGQTPSVSNFPAYTHGKELFTSNCASCHNRNMKDMLTGPPLGGVRSRWSGFPEKDLYNYIRDPQRLIKARHPRALQLWKEFNPTLMTSFTSLTDEDIKDLLTYIEAY